MLTKDSFKVIKDLPEDLEQLLGEIHEIKDREQGIENERQSAEYFLKISLQDSVLAIFTFTSILSFILYCECRLMVKDSNDILILAPLWILTINNMLFIICTIARSFIMLKLLKSTQSITYNDTIFSTNIYQYLILELTLAILCPGIYFHGIKVTTDAYMYLMEVTYELNDFLGLVLFLRVYVLFRAMLNYTKYYNARCQRVSKMIGSKMSRMFAIRCIIQTRPFTLLTLGITATSLSLAYMLKTTEGPAYLLSESAQAVYNNLNSFENCIWTILVTMTTVGYGDFSPLTTFGRILYFIASILGSVQISLVVVTFQQKFFLKDTEESSFLFFDRILAKEKIEKAGGFYFKNTFQFMCKKRKLINFLKNKNDNKSGNEDEYRNLKGSMIKNLYKRIKSHRNFKEEFHHFRTTYDSFSMYDIVKNKLREVSAKVETFYEMENELRQLIQAKKEENKAEFEYKNKLEELKIKEELIRIKLQNIEEREKRIYEDEKNFKKCSTFL